MRYSQSRILCGLLLMTLLLGACSTTGVIYNRADWLIKRQLGNYLEDLNSEQQRHLDHALRDYMTWHRESEMPRYRDYLLALEKDVQKPLSPPLIAQRMEQGFDFWQTLMERAMPGVVTMLQSLSDEQVEVLLANIHEQQRRPWDDVEADDDAAVAAVRRDSVEKSLRRWIGRPTTEQQALLTQWSSKVHNTYPQAKRQQQLWAQEFADALSERHNTALLTERMRVLFMQPDSLWSDIYRDQLRENQRHTTHLLIDIHASLTDRQQSRLQARLARYARHIDGVLD